MNGTIARDLARDLPWNINSGRRVACPALGPQGETAVGRVVVKSEAWVGAESWIDPREHPLPRDAKAAARRFRRRRREHSPGSPAGLFPRPERKAGAMLLLLLELRLQDQVVVRRCVPELRHEQRRVHRSGLPFGKRIALVIAAPRVRCVRRLLAGQRVDCVDMRVRVHGEHDVRIRADRQAQVRWEICHLAQQAGVDKNQMAPVADPEVAIAA